MPSKWAMVDNSFPTFAEEEKPQQSIMKLTDYIFILVEELKYQLENLDAGNWNTAALQEIQTETTANVEQSLSRLAASMAMLQNQVNTAAASQGARISALETDVGYLEEKQAQLEAELEALAEGQTAMEAAWDELNGRIGVAEQSLELLTGVVAAGENGTVIGKAGQDLHLIGNVYVNGVLLEQE